jgi:alpha-methylacyl-CoA racemase
MARGTFVEHDGVVQPAAAPRFSRTPGAAGRVATGDAATILKAWGI